MNSAITQKMTQFPAAVGCILSQRLHCHERLCSLTSQFWKRRLSFQRSLLRNSFSAACKTQIEILCKSSTSTNTFMKARISMGSRCFEDKTTSDNHTPSMLNSVGFSPYSTAKPNFSISKGVFTLDEIYEHLNDVNAEDIFVLQLANHVMYVDFFIVVTGRSGRHIAQMAELTNQLYKQRRSPDDPYTVIEGKRDSDSWQVIDMGNMVVHFMSKETREKYQLEKLWALGPEFDDHDQVSKEDADPIKLFELHSLKLLSGKGGEAKALEGEDLIDPWDASFEKTPKDLHFEEVSDEDEYII